MSAWAGHTGAELAEAWGVPVVEAFTSVGSTNDRAAELGRAGSPRPAVVIAEEQTAGRGRRGDRWQSAAGAGIWLSLLVEARHGFPQLPLVVGVACACAVERVAGPGPRVRVKWPNDLLVEDGKVGGILCESGPYGVVIGVGLNVRAPEGGFEPAHADSAAALEVAAGKPLSRMQLASFVVAEILARLSEEDPFAGVRDELRRRDALLDRAVVTDFGGPGLGRGIDPSGALLLERPDGSTIAVGSGSVRLTDADGSG